MRVLLRQPVLNCRIKFRSLWPWWSLQDEIFKENCLWYLTTHQCLLLHKCLGIFFPSRTSTDLLELLCRTRANKTYKKRMDIANSYVTILKSKVLQGQQSKERSLNQGTIIIPCFLNTWSFSLRLTRFRKSWALKIPIFACLMLISGCSFEHFGPTLHATFWCQDYSNKYLNNYICI